MHAGLLVIHNEHDDIDELLRPFDEDNEEYFTFDYDEDYCVPADEMNPEDADKEGMVLDDTGEFYGYMHNENGYYDWYEIGGRYINLLPLKDGSFANSAKIRDIDIDCLPNPPYYYDADADRWHDTGMMVFIPADEEQTKEFREFIRNYDPEAIITIVDIHY